MIRSPLAPFHPREPDYVARVQARSDFQQAIMAMHGCKDKAA